MRIIDHRQFRLVVFFILVVRFLFRVVFRRVFFGRFGGRARRLCRSFRVFFDQPQFDFQRALEIFFIDKPVNNPRIKGVFRRVQSAVNPTFHDLRRHLAICRRLLDKILVIAVKQAVQHFAVRLWHLLEHFGLGAGLVFADIRMLRRHANLIEQGAIIRHFRAERGEIDHAGRRHENFIR